MRHGEDAEEVVHLARTTVVTNARSAPVIRAASPPNVKRQAESPVAAQEKMSRTPEAGAEWHEECFGLPPTEHSPDLRMLSFKILIDITIAIPNPDRTSDHTA